MAFAVAPHVRPVIASDLSAGTLRQVERLVDQHQVTNVSIGEQDVEALTFADDTFDAATCRIAAPHSTNIDAATSEIARVLRALVRQAFLDADDLPRDYFEIEMSAGVPVTYTDDKLLFRS